MPALLDALLGLVCHQLPDRSPAFADARFPLCYRCAGLYLGIAAAYATLAVTGGRRRRLPGPRAATLASLFLLPLLVDGWANLLGLWSTAAWARALTGALAGIALPALLLPLAGHGPAGERRSTLSSPVATVAGPLLAAVLVASVVAPASRIVFDGLALLAGLAFAGFAIDLGRAAYRALRHAPPPFVAGVEELNRIT